MAEIEYITFLNKEAKFLYIKNVLLNSCMTPDKIIQYLKKGLPMGPKLVYYRLIFSKLILLA